MRKDLAKEVRKTAAREFWDMLPLGVAVYSGEIDTNTESPPELTEDENFTTPAVGAFRVLSHTAIVDGSMLITRVSDGTEYVEGVDYTVNYDLGRVTNLAMPVGITVNAAYSYRDTSTGGGTMTGPQILAALLLVDGSGSLLDSDMVDGQHASAFATAGHNHDTVYVKKTDNYVVSVNTKTGVVTLDAHDVGAYAQSETYNRAQVDALVGEGFGFSYATLVKYGL